MVQKVTKVSQFEFLAQQLRTKVFYINMHNLGAATLGTFPQSLLLSMPIFYLLVRGRSR
jgi:hypothetical protein